MKSDEMNKTRNAMLYTNVFLGSQTLLFTSEKGKEKAEEEEEKEKVIFHVLLGFGAVYRLCSLPQNQTRAALYSAPSMDFVKQTSKPASV